MLVISCRRTTVSLASANPWPNLERYAANRTAVNNFIAIGQESPRKQNPLDKNQLYVNLSEIKDGRFNVNAADKVLNKLFYEEQP